MGSTFNYLNKIETLIKWRQTSLDCPCCPIHKRCVDSSSNIIEWEAIQKENLFQITKNMHVGKGGALHGECTTE